MKEWTSVAVSGGFLYTGKSFNSYNATTKLWEQHWIDNVGGGTNYVHGKFEDKKIIFLTDPFQFSKDTIAISKLTFFNLGPGRVRQPGEISKVNGTTWQPNMILIIGKKNDQFPTSMLQFLFSQFPLL